MAKRHLTIVLPGLAIYHDQGWQPASHLKLLSRFFKKGRFKSLDQSLSTFLINSFSTEPVIGHDLPAAAIRQSGITSICADPCYLHPDRDRLVLFSEDISLTDQEADMLIEHIQPLLDSIQATLKRHTAKQWLLALEHAPGINCHALPHVEGKAIVSYLPKGPAQAEWLRLGNEIQMLLSMLPLNEARQARGDLPVNSLWFWGQGEMHFNTNAWQQCAGPWPLLSTLAERIECEYQQSMIDINEWLTQNDQSSLLVSPSLNPMDVESMLAFEQNVLHPVWQRLRAGQLEQLRLFVPDWGSYILSRWDTWKPW